MSPRPTSTAHHHNGLDLGRGAVTRPGTASCAASTAATLRGLGTSATCSRSWTTAPREHGRPRAGERAARRRHARTAASPTEVSGFTIEREHRAGQPDRRDDGLHERQQCLQATLPVRPGHPRALVEGHRRHRWRHRARSAGELHAQARLRTATKASSSTPRTTTRPRVPRRRRASTCPTSRRSWRSSHRRDDERRGDTGVQGPFSDRPARPVRRRRRAHAGRPLQPGRRRPWSTSRCSAGVDIDWHLARHGHGPPCPASRRTSC